MVHLYRMGTDPEFVFVKPVDSVPVLVSAQKVISLNKDLTLKSYIGTDGHASTAELRPAPAHNINRIMFGLASALDYIAKYLASKEKYRGVSAMAHPVVAGEKLGGHIHTSFWINDPDMAAMVRSGYMYSDGEFYPMSGVAHSTLGSTVQDAIRKKVEDEDLFTPAQYLRVMDYLLAPFELWCQNWMLRANRMTQGSHVNEPYRINQSTPNQTLARGRFADHAYIHIEYRTPSTWLTHPWLAYSYLALGKLTMLNYDKIVKLSQHDKHLKMKANQPEMTDGWGVPSPTAPKAAVVPANDKNKDIFAARLAKLVSGGARLTPDLEDLELAISKVEKWRERWVNPQTTINFNAWGKLL